MTELGFYLSKLVIKGQSQSSAEVSFEKGLNVIVGASNTGKTFIFRAINFMLGGQEPPQEIPQSRGYTNSLLEIRSRKGQIYTMSRSLAGGNSQLFELPVDEISGKSPSRQLGAKAIKGDSETVSAFLLDLMDLRGKEVRRNELGQKSILSFRDVAWLTMVDEERIITEGSPLLSGQYTEATKEKAVFGLFLTGTDDAAIVAQEKPGDRKARLRSELNLLSELIKEREETLKKIGIETSALQAKRKELETAIQQASAIVATRQKEIDALVKRRDKAWRDHQKVISRRLFLGEQIKRLQLLSKHYESDRARLEAAHEAGLVFERLASGQCLVCGHMPNDTDAKVITNQLSEFERSCRAEIDKIGALSKDLGATLEEMAAEDRRLQESEAQLKDILAAVNKEIDEALQPQLEDADEQLSNLLGNQSLLIEAETTQAEIASLYSRRASIEQALEIKIAKQKLSAKVETRTAAKFCEVVFSTLQSWKYPHLSTVAFDPNRFDLVIGDQNRGSMGKGYRALTHAAFLIALMRYCRMEKLPHPGFVVLDTPLNPFRGPDDPKSDFVNQEVQNALYEDLSKDRSGDQVIILENTEPPAGLVKDIHYVHFSAVKSKGRYGFFPVSL